MIDELPRELADLFAAERAAPVSDLVRASALRAKLAASVGSAPLGTAAAAGGIGKALATIALVVAAGGGALAVHHGTPPHLASTIAAVHAPEPPVALTPPEPAPVVEPAPPEVASRAFPRKRPAPPAPAAAPPARVEPDVEPAPVGPTEVTLLRDAWRALSANDPQAALDLATRDATLHPDGALAEERDALVIEALATLGHRDDARTSARTFFEHHPASVHRARIERALQEPP